MESVERFQMIFESKINYLPGPMNVDQEQHIFVEADLPSLPSHQRASESNQAWRGQTSDSEGESVALLMQSDDELSTNSSLRGNLVGKLKARAHDAGNKHASEGQGSQSPMEVANEVSEARNSVSVSLAPDESIRGDSEQRGIENVSKDTYLELGIDLYTRRLRQLLLLHNDLLRLEEVGVQAPAKCRPPDDSVVTLKAIHLVLANQAPS
jgi:hypothetical protein